MYKINKSRDLILSFGRKPDIIIEELNAFNTLQ